MLAFSLKQVLCAFLLCLACATVFATEAEAEVVSCYGMELAGQPTASGESFSPGNMTMAHRTLPFGTKVLLRHGDASVVVTVNDRGPFVGDRWGDLSCGAMHALGLPTGVHDVGVTVL